MFPARRLQAKEIEYKNECQLLISGTFDTPASHIPHMWLASLHFILDLFLASLKSGTASSLFFSSCDKYMRIHTCSLSLRWHSVQVLGKATNSHILSSSWGAVITILEEAGLSPKLLYNAKLRSWYNYEIEHICWFRFCCHDTWRSRQCNGTSSCSLIFIKLKLTLKNTRV